MNWWAVVEIAVFVDLAVAVYVYLAVLDMLLVSSEVGHVRLKVRFWLAITCILWPVDVIFVQPYEKYRRK